MRTFFTLLIFLPLCLCFNARAEVNGHPEKMWDREVIHLTNSDPYPVTVRFNFSYDYKCGDEYSEWQHYDGQNMGESIPGSGETNHVVYFPGCSTATEVTNPRLQFLSAMRLGPPTPTPPQPSQPGNNGGPTPPQPGQPPQQPQYPQQPQNPQQPQYPYTPQTPNQAPPQACAGPLGYWAARHTTALGSTSWSTIENHRIQLHALGHVYTAVLGQLDLDSVFVSCGDGTCTVMLDAVGGESTITDNGEDGTPHGYNMSMTFEFNSLADAQAAQVDLKNLITECRGYAFNELVKPSRKSLEPAAIALEADPSALKTVEIPIDGSNARPIDAVATRID